MEAEFLNHLFVYVTSVSTFAKQDKQVLSIRNIHLTRKSILARAATAIPTSKNVIAFREPTHEQSQPIRALFNGLTTCLPICTQ